LVKVEETAHVVVEETRRKVEETREVTKSWRNNSWSNTISRQRV